METPVSRIIANKNRGPINHFDPARFDAICRDVLRICGEEMKKKIGDKNIRMAPNYEEFRVVERTAAIIFVLEALESEVASLNELPLHRLYQEQLAKMFNYARSDGKVPSQTDKDDAWDCAEAVSKAAKDLINKTLEGEPRDKGLGNSPA